MRPVDLATPLLIVCSIGCSARARSRVVLDDARATDATFAADSDERGDSGTSAALAPLRSPSGLYEELSLSTHASAVLSVPIGTTRPRPILVVAHGNYDRPEWECSVWRSLLRNRAWILCLRGRVRTDVPFDDRPRYSYPSEPALAAEIADGIAALEARHGAYVDRGAIAYAGFSLGAIYGPGVLRRLPRSTELAVMVEGSASQWNRDAIASFRQRGGRRLLFACGQRGCVVDARELLPRLRGAGIDARVVYAAGAGHSYSGPVAIAIGEALDWLLEGDPRFAVGWSG